MLFDLPLIISLHVIQCDIGIIIRRTLLLTQDSQALVDHLQAMQPGQSVFLHLEILFLGGFQG